MKSNISVPELRNYQSLGNSKLGYITVAEENLNVPFDIKRVYWTYFTPNDVIRGGHAHKELEQVIFAVSGVINFTVETTGGIKQTFTLDNPNIGLYIPKLVWRDIKFSHNAVLLCLASEYYIEDDYIRDYEDFIKLRSKV